MNNNSSERIRHTERQSNSSFNQRIIAQKWLSGVLTHYDTSKQKIVQQSHLRDMKL